MRVQGRKHWCFRPFALCGALPTLTVPCCTQRARKGQRSPTIWNAVHGAGRALGRRALTPLCNTPPTFPLGRKRRPEGDPPLHPTLRDPSVRSHIPLGPRIRTRPLAARRSPSAVRAAERALPERGMLARCTRRSDFGDDDEHHSRNMGGLACCTLDIGISRRSAMATTDRKFLDRLKRRDPDTLKAVADEHARPVYRGGRLLGLRAARPRTSRRTCSSRSSPRSPASRGAPRSAPGCSASQALERRRGLADDARHNPIDEQFESQFDQRGRWKARPAAPDRLAYTGFDCSVRMNL